jgi:hypothetical protein
MLCGGGVAEQSVSWSNTVALRSRFEQDSLFESSPFTTSPMGFDFHFHAGRAANSLSKTPGGSTIALSSSGKGLQIAGLACLSQG